MAFQRMRGTCPTNDQRTKTMEDKSVETCTTFPIIPLRKYLQRYYEHFISLHSSSYDVHKDVVKLVVSFANHAFDIGDAVLANDGLGVYEAKIVEIQERSVVVNFNGWNENFNQSITIDESNPKVINFRWNDPIRPSWERVPKFSLHEEVTVIYGGMKYTCQVVDLIGEYVKVTYGAEWGSGWDEWIEETDETRLRKLEANHNAE
jgi:hypothetical protein